VTDNILDFQAVEIDASEQLKTEAFGVLAKAVEGLTTASARNPTASEVRLEMKRRTHGGFDPKLVGFKRFREFLTAAADAGFVTLDTTRLGDVAVGRAEDSTVSSAHENFVRPDLWRAFIDWDLERLRCSCSPGMRV